MTDRTWTVELIEDPETGELLLPFPPDMLAQVGWDFGDTIQWDVDEDLGIAVLTKSPKSDG
jgi:hypothetical protein